MSFLSHFSKKNRDTRKKQKEEKQKLEEGFAAYRKEMAESYNRKSQKQQDKEMVERSMARSRMPTIPENEAFVILQARQELEKERGEKAKTEKTIKELEKRLENLLKDGKKKHRKTRKTRKTRKYK